MSSVLGSGVTSSQLGALTDASGEALVECTQFVDGYSWGPVKTADVTIGGVTASGLSVQVIGDPAYAGLVPSACTQPVNNSENSVATFGANAILGIGNYLADCGPSCPADGTAYSYCSASLCAGTSPAVTQQVSNPVAALAADNNGVSITLPSVPNAGATSISGTMTFGIGTETNNGLGGAQIYQFDPSSGYIRTTYAGTSLDKSFIDSGSNAYFFANAGSNSALQTCPSPNQSFYCPSSDLSLTATISGYNGTSSGVSFVVTNLDNLLSTIAVDPGLAGPASSQTPSAFDWGLPFFFVRTVFVGFENTTIGSIVGPFIAF